MTRRSRSSVRAGKTATHVDVEVALSWLKERASKRTRDGMARFGLPSGNALGVPVGTIKQIGKRIGVNHDLALGLFKTGVYEAQLLAAFVGDPARLTAAQMDRWCRAFDNWGVVDTVCFSLFDRTPLAWSRIEPWSQRSDEFEKRAAFALLACLALHDKGAPDDALRKCLPIVEAGASDERNFVKKGVLWALRLIGRRSADLHAESIALARRLAASKSPSAKWIGRSTLRDLTSAALAKKFSGKKRTAK